MKKAKRLLSFVFAVLLISNILTTPTKATDLGDISADDNAVLQGGSTSCQDGLHFDYPETFPCNFLCSENTIPVSFALAGLDIDESCTLQINSSTEITHTLNTNHIYTADNALVNFEIQVLSPSTVLTMNSMYAAVYDYITITAITDGEIPREYTATLNVLNSQHGLFVGLANEEAVFDFAAKYLYDNNIIDHSTYSAAIVSSYCAPETPQEQATAAQIMSTNSTGSTQGTTVTVKYTITALNGGAQLKVDGTVNWTDINGSSHAAYGVLVSVFDNSTIDPIAEIHTNSTGSFTCTFDNDLSSENGYDLYLNICPKTKDFSNSIGYEDVYYIDVQSTDLSDYSLDTSAVCGVHQNVTSSVAEQTAIFLASNKTNAMQIHQAAHAGLIYAQQVGSTYPTPVYIKYPDTDCDYHYGTSIIRVTSGSYYAWDVLLHEYGHHIAYINDVIYPVGGRHSYQTDLITQYGKMNGCRLAWSEGWATYFSMAAQEMTYADDIGVPLVGDGIYDSPENSVSVNVESNYGYGEGNEMAVFCALWDFADSTSNNEASVSESYDYVSMGFNKVIQYSFECEPGTLSNYMNHIYEEYGIYSSTYRNIGAILGWQNVAAEYLYCDESCMEFSFNVGQGSSSNSISYYLEIYDPDTMSLLYTQFIDSRSSSTAYLYCIPPSQILSDLSNGYTAEIYWCIKAVPTSSPATGPYYSQFLLASMSEFR